jgi:hypothetical protein
MAEPTIAEASRVLDGLLRAGVIRRLDMMHAALCSAYRVGQQDRDRERDQAQEQER